LAGKPIGLLGVAAGAIGAIKSLEHLRSVLAHVGAIVMPLLISVPNVRTVFDEQGRCLNPQLAQQIRSVATILMHYLEDAVCPRVTLEAMLRGEQVGV
jgi:chromate reductase, NAD(P)H dehydrogenase (quinone)